MSKQKSEKLTLAPEKKYPQQLFVQIEGKLTEEPAILILAISPRSA